MVYADYSYYCSSGYSAVSEADFPRLAAKASAYLDKLTHGRAAEHADDERLKRCCCEMVDTLTLTADSGGMVKQSESVGSWSMSLAGAESMTETQLVRGVVNIWLPNDWLYKGVGRE